jgi:serine/threonine protein kinase/TolB-like protein/Tfp pilus assembly protein PilF
MVDAAVTSGRPVCRRCGVELSSEDSQSGFCFSCLLLPALDLDESREFSDSGSRFDHYDVRTRADGSLIELGRGSMGVTYEAVDTRLQFRVALKVIYPRGTADKPELDPPRGSVGALRERFLREARAAAQLRHPHVANVLYYGVRRDGRCFYAMELVEGQSVAQRVRSGRPLPVTDALEIISQTASALEAAEKLGLVHRDLKPANLMLADGPGINVKVIDFGLAKIVGAQDDANKITYDCFVGTPAFASPEQFLGSPIDHRSDYFSLGVTLFYLLTLDFPFKPGQLSGIRGQVNGGMPALDKLKAASVPLPVIELIGSLLAADPENRPQTGNALNGAIRECQRTLASSSLTSIVRTQDHSRGNQISGSDAEPIKPVAEGGSRRPNSKGRPPAAVEETARLHAPELVLWRVRRFISMKRIAVALAAGLMILSGLIFLCYRQVFPARPALVLPDKSVAVLPFANISANKDDAYFAEGMHDEILNHLARISQLKVISRTSVMRYAADPKRDLREIARTLGASAIVEGTVLREANRVRINVELIDPRTDVTIWADSYDRDLSSVFAIQSDIAQAVAAKLAATLLPIEQRLILRKPTQNMAAYDLYLKAQELIRENDLSGLDFDERSSKAIALLEQAIQIDPQFALAYNSAGHAHDLLYITYDQTPDRLASADRAFETALRLAPDLPEVQLNYAYHLYYGYRDYEGAKTHLDMARKAGMSKGYGLQLPALIDRRQGRFEAAAQEFRAAAELDPQNPDPLSNLAYTLYANRQFREAGEVYDRLIALLPNKLSCQIEKYFYVTFMETGDFGPVVKAIEQTPASEAEDSVTLTSLLGFSLMAKNWERAEALVKKLEAAGDRADAGFGYALAPVPPGCYSLLLARLRHDPIVPSHLESRDLLGKWSAAAPSNALLLSTLAIVDALLGGRNAQAIQEAEHAVEMLPISKDAMDGPSVLANLAVVHACCGELDKAFNELAVLVKTPNGIYYGELKQEPFWEPLRSDPRFDKLLADLAPMRE